MSFLCAWLHCGCSSCAVRHSCTRRALIASIASGLSGSRSWTEDGVANDTFDGAVVASAGAGAAASSSGLWPWLGRHLSGSSSEVSCVALGPLVSSRFDLVKLRVRLRKKPGGEGSPVETAFRDFERKVAVRCNKFLKLFPEVAVRRSAPFREMPLEMLRRIDGAAFFSFFSLINELIFSFSSCSSAEPVATLCTLCVDLSPFLKAFFSSCGSSASFVSLLRISAISSEDTSVGFGLGASGSGSGVEAAHPIAESESLWLFWLCSLCVALAAT